jgi:hypothetical protein
MGAAFCLWFKLPSSVYYRDFPSNKFPNKFVKSIRILFLLVFMKNIL